MRPLRATVDMMEIERDDVPQKLSGGYGVYRKYARFARCQVECSILKVALFFPDNLRTGGYLPSYEVYVDRTAGKFITYDRMTDKWRTAKLDNLDWPYYVRATDGIWMSPADTKTVQAYLGGNQGGYNGVLDYQEKVRAEALARRHKRTTDAWDTDLSPTRPLPKDWDRWVDKVGVQQNYIFYHYKKRGAKEGYCTYCGKNVPISKPRYNKAVRCPCCRHEAVFKSIGKLDRLSTDWNCVYLLQPRPDGFIVREFWAARIYEKDAWETPRVVCMEQLRTIYDDQLHPRTYFWGNYKHRGFRWVKGMPNPSWYSPESNYYYGGRPGRVYGKGLSHLFQSKLGDTGIARFLYGDHFFMEPNEYLYEQKKEFFKELISKAGLPRLASECLSNDPTLFEVFKGGVRDSLTKAMGLDTQRLGRLRRNDGGMIFLAWLRWEKGRNTVLDDTVTSRFCEWGIGPPDIAFIMDRMSPLQVHNYLLRQTRESGEKARQVLTTWKDYLAMAKKQGMDTNDSIVYRARLLRQRHDELVARRYREDSKSLAAEALETFPDVDKICRAIKEKFQYADDKYAVVVPDGILDIIVEGKQLCHCVGGQDRYWDRIQRHEAYILFLRKASAPNTPYYTLEVEPDGTVRQVRTKFDRQGPDIDAVRGFLTGWQKVVTARLTNGDREEAAVSRVLREQEFEQMRKDNVIIHVGHLAGRRLVDVLTADLMENVA